ncbi:MAG: hypothetical protein RIS79_3506 [Verrucomicrobiota bacterium]|jgi:hypothetical protein
MGEIEKLEACQAELARRYLELLARCRVLEGMVMMLRLDAGIPLEQTEQQLQQAGRAELDRLYIALEDSVGPTNAAIFDRRPVEGQSGDQQCS